MQNLRDLPPGASFTDKQAQANVKVRWMHDTLYVDASCDSLQRLVDFQSKELTRIRNDTENHQSSVTEKQTTGVQSLFKVFLSGFGLGVLLISILVFTIKFK